ncbi:MAG: V4R domain-containing protein [Acidobacteriota bacterium]
MPESESLQAALVLAGFDALRMIGGDALVQILLLQAGEQDLENLAASDARIPIEQYLRYRDAALDFLGDSFATTAFQTGKILVRKLEKERPPQMTWLLDQYKHAANQLPLIGQAAVLASAGNPGKVTAKMKTKDVLLITIERCPECRGLERFKPFCNINQGVISEFAHLFLNLGVSTKETRCMAMGHDRCEIEVVVEEVR